MSLVNQDTGLMNALGLEAFLINSSLESLVQKFIDCQTKHIIELEFFITKETVSVHSVEECGTFEKSSGIFFLKGKQLSGGFSELGEEEMNSPYFTFVFKTVLADQLKFVIDSFLFEGSSWGFKC